MVKILNISIPSYLYEELEETREKLKLNRSELVQEFISKGIEQKKKKVIKIIENPVDMSPKPSPDEAKWILEPIFTHDYIQVYYKSMEGFRPSQKIYNK